VSAVFDPAIQPVGCEGCGERVARANGRCPICATLTEAGGARRPLVAPLEGPPLERYVGRADAHDADAAPDALARPARVGPFVLEAEPVASGPDYAWVPARRGERGEPAHMAKVARHAGAAAALRRETRRAARLSEECPAAPRPLAFHEADAGEAAAVVVPRLAAARAVDLDLRPGEVLVVAAELARLDAAALHLGLAWEVRPEDVLLERPDGGGPPRTWVTGLHRLADGLGWDARLGASAWAATVASLAGLPRSSGGVELEARPDLPPRLLAALRAGLQGEGRPVELLEAAGLLPPAGPRPAVEARGRAARGLTGCIDAARVSEAAPARAFTLYAIDRAGEPEGGLARWWGLDPALDAVVQLVAPHHPDRDPRAFRERTVDFHEAGRVDLTSAPLEAALRRARAPYVRHGQPFRIEPVVLPPDPPPAAPDAPAPELSLARAEGGGALVTVGVPDGLEVALVRSEAGAPLLVPEDGHLVATLGPGAEPVADPDAGDRCRYAAFPLVGGAPASPARAGFDAGQEVGAVAVAPKVGALEVRWEAPDDAVVLVRGGKAPVETVRDGDLLYWGRERRELLQDCLDPDEEVHYRVFALGPRGTFSAGQAASGAALGPPPALGPVKASPGQGRVTLAWAWPAGRSYDRVLVRREPGWPDGERAVLRDADPTLTDAEAPVGETMHYRLRTALGDYASRHEEDVSAQAIAELAAFRALAGGRSVVLEVELPDGLPGGARVEVVRNTEREPRDMEDGSVVRLDDPLRHVDAPLAAGERVRYRACLKLGRTRSAGLTAEATPVEQAGELGPLHVGGERGLVRVRYEPPAERCERVDVFAGPAAEPLPGAPIPHEGHTLELPATPGVPWRVRAVPVHQGCADASQALEATATAWDDLSGLAVRAVPDAVELSWTPPGGTPTGYRLRRRPQGRDDEPWTEVELPGDAARHADADVQPRRTYTYRLACVWGEGERAVETEAHEAEARVVAMPAELDRPTITPVPGGVRVRYLPPGGSDRVHFEGAVVYESERPVTEVRRALAELGRPWHTEDEAAGLGLRQVAERKRSRKRETLRVGGPPEGEVRLVLLASRNGPLRRVCAEAPVVGLPEGFLALRAVPASLQPKLAWTVPGWLTGGGAATLQGLALVRGLEDADVEGLDASELAELSAPWRRELEPRSGEATDEDALPFVAWGYTLEATLDVAGAAVEVSGPRLVVPGKRGGTVRPAAEQARGLFGKKSQVEVTFAVDGAGGFWPPFELVRSLAGQEGGKVVLRHGGSEAPRPFVDDDLSAFTKGTRLVYRVRLTRPRDALGFEGGATELTLG